MRKLTRLPQAGLRGKDNKLSHLYSKSFKANIAGGCDIIIV